MPALLPLPAENETVLTGDELKQITGAAATRQQVLWLRENRWQFSADRHGAPIVGRLYANLKLGGLEMKYIVNPNDSGWQPNVGALG